MGLVDRFAAIDRITAARLWVVALAGLMLVLAVPAFASGASVVAAATSSSSSSSSSSGGSSAAKATAEKLAPLTVTERDALLGRLTDEQARDLLIYYLAQTAPGEAAAGGTSAASSITVIKTRMVALRDSLAATLGRAGHLFSEYIRLMDAKLGIKVGGGGIVLVIGYVIGLSLAGGIAEFIYRLLTRKMVERYEAAPTQTEREKLTRAFGQLLHGIGAIATFAGGFALAFLSIWGGNVERREFTIVVLLAILLTRISVAIVRVVFLPKHPQWRIMPVDDEAAAHFVRGTRRQAILGAFLLLFGTLGHMWGVDADVWRFGALMSGILFTISVLIFLWRYRNHLLRSVDVAMGTDIVPRWAESAAGWGWYALAVVYVLAAFLIGTYDLLLGLPFDPLDAVIGFFILFVFNPYLTAVLTGVLAPDVPLVVHEKQAVFVTDPDDGERVRTTLEGDSVVVEGGNPTDAEAEAQAEAEAEAIEEAVEHSPAVMRDRRVLKRVISMAVLVVSLLAFAMVIGVNIFSTAQEYPIAQFGLRVLLNVGVVALLGYVAWAFIAAWIDRKLAEEKAKLPVHEEEEESAGPMMTSGTRLQTILPIVRRFIQITLAVMAVMVILASMGVNIAPLIAGAGVIGLAVGFGAQTLVKDLISGLFFLMDDAFRIGEYIEAGDVAGTVEKFNARSLVLRGYLGAVYTVPYGELGKITNYSRDWVIMKLRFRVPFDTDVDLVRKLFKKIGKEMLEDEELGPNFLQPFKSQGVVKMDDSAFIVSGKFMTKPNKQWGVRKAVYEKVQQAFKEYGIKFAPKRVIVDMPTAATMEDDGDEPADQGAAKPAVSPVAAAAAAAASDG